MSAAPTTLITTAELRQLLIGPHSTYKLRRTWRVLQLLAERHARAKALGSFDEEDETFRASQGAMAALDHELRSIAELTPGVLPAIDAAIAADHTAPEAQ
ncbi:hypothetical protein [Streptomyces chilikensis]|uniref:hypothetical protein n=1 Tax=Streptomyces chilikensis TaxID=1194079 RepID=UPI001407B1B0|nr:hypothetical protein [Streptomyces chilikensis]